MPADFGLGEGFRTYTGWAQEELEQQLVPLLRVQFGENELVKNGNTKSVTSSDA